MTKQSDLECLEWIISLCDDAQAEIGSYESELEYPITTIEDIAFSISSPALCEIADEIENLSISFKNKNYLVSWDTGSELQYYSPIGTDADSIREFIDELIGLIIYFQTECEMAYNFSS